jgi:hypothetical protein
VQAPHPPPPSDPGGAEQARTSFERARWGTFRSRRFELSLGLPDGARWKIDDHRANWLTAEHPPSRSSLWLRTWPEDGVATRKLCYARAREWLSSLPDLDGAPLIEDRVRPLFAGLDTRVAVGVEAPEAGATGAVGFVVAAGAGVHRCVVVAFRTRAEGAGGEDEVAARLLLVSERLLPAVQLDQSLAPSRELPTPSLRGVPGTAR